MKRFFEVLAIVANIITIASFVFMLVQFAL